MANQPSFLGIPRELRDLVYPYLSNHVCATWHSPYNSWQPVEIVNAPPTNIMLVSRQIRAEYLASKPYEGVTVIVHVRVSLKAHPHPMCSAPARVDKVLDDRSYENVLHQARHLKLLFSIDIDGRGRWDSHFDDLYWPAGRWNVKTIKVGVHYEFRNMHGSMVGLDRDRSFLNGPPLDYMGLLLLQHAHGYRYQTHPHPTELDIKNGVYLYANSRKAAATHQWTKQETFDTFPTSRIGSWNDPVHDRATDLVMMVLNKVFLEVFQSVAWKEVQID